MAENRNEKMEAIVSLAKRRGFIYQGSDVYGGLSGTWDYGPLGVTLKRNIMNLWWDFFVEQRDDMYGLDAAILMNQKVWQASGHVDTFTDPLVECLSCKTRYRADKFVSAPATSQDDKLWMEKWVDAYRAIHGYDDQNDLSKAADATRKSFLEKKIVCASCKKPSEFTGPRQFNMMFQTTVGSVLAIAETSKDRAVSEVKIRMEGDEQYDDAVTPDHGNGLDSVLLYNHQSKSYLRPETAQGIFTNYKNVVDTFYPDLPFGIAQVGKAFRNEISPRDFIFRSREFEQMEIEYFVEPDKWETSFEALRTNVHEFLDKLGLPTEAIHELEVPENDRAHYSQRTIDFEFDFPIGREELLGLAYRTDFDLKNIERESGKSMEYTLKGTNTKFVPHVIEPSFGVERALMAVLASSYTEDEINGEKRVVLKLPKHLAPVKYAVAPLLKNKPELVEKAQEVYKALKKKHGAVMWDDNGNIGKRYRRQDEIGTPHCVVIDFQTLEDDTVTIRDRDTTEQKRVKIGEWN